MTVFAACDTASTFASDICAASSTNSTSTVSTASGRDHSQPVPPPTEASTPKRGEHYRYGFNCAKPHEALKGTIGKPLMSNSHKHAFCELHGSAFFSA